MKLYEINREERHFGFLFLSALVSYPEFRKEMFDRMNSHKTAIPMHLNPLDFDVYAEAAIFRDYWNNLGDYKKDNGEVHSRRRAVLEDLLGALEIDTGLIDKYDMFWTGPIGKSKLWYPGKWSEAKIQDIEKKEGIEEKRLWRCRWLCNAKPDIMIHSPKNILFIEVKVESGMGAGNHGYNQGDTQQDIITVGKRVIDWMKDADIGRLTLTHGNVKGGITWQQVIEAYNRTITKPDAGMEMIARHLQHMPKEKQSKTEG